MKNKAITIGCIIFLAGIAQAADAICDWWQPATWGACIILETYSIIYGQLLSIFYGLLSFLILTNPNIAIINPMFRTYMSLLQPIFELAILATGFYLLFVSGSPAGRARAKDMFWKLMLGLIAVSLSPEIFKILMEIAAALSLKMMASATGNVDMGGLMTAQFMVFGVVIIPMFAITLLFTIVSVGIRWFGVLIMASLFPWTLFFYLFEPPFLAGITKNISHKMWRWTLGFIFAQPVQALMLSITAIAFNGIPSMDFWANILAFFIGIAGLIMITAAPLMTMQLLNWLGGGLMAYGMYTTLAKGNILGGAVANAAGGMMLGSGPGSLMAAGGTASMGFAQKMGKQASEGRLNMDGREAERPRTQSTSYVARAKRDTSARNVRPPSYIKPKK